VGREHLRRLVSRHVTLELLALLATLRFVRGQEGFNAGGLLLQALKLLLALLLLDVQRRGSCLLLFIGALMLRQDLLELRLSLRLLLS